MKFPCSITRSSSGEWLIRHESSDVGIVETRAESREKAVEKMRLELRYVLELCPCTGEAYKDLDIELVES